MDNKKPNNEDGDDFSRRFGEKESQRMIEGAYVGDDLQFRATSVVSKALGDLPTICPSCGDLCDEHCIRLRDAFFSRALQLTDRMLRGLDLYLQERDYGVVEPVETINTIYRIWGELALLHELVEPQAREVDDVDGEEVEE